ncbi:probable cation/acetate symporter ActP [Hyphomonas neptunium ATCC 15444]|uniref:Sodium/proline symporter n=2 Tax=Hyphomonas TaxID=85 RepID=Q0C391_HYPNA|nr:sodium/proline symporter [Hyphomonas hirschiana]ABI76888.1 probable cation/acetate symporter ActP [Hyphomonas neptunium ATCC 15444]KCZ95963.1 cation/acetate symporter ActP [Hyphomonas hirschiana VP5]
MRANLPALITLIVYAVLLVGVSLWASRKVRSEASSFLLGGRSLGPLVSGLAYAASSSSAWVLLGYSGFVYATGLSALWMIPGILLGYGAVWLFAGPVLQAASRDKDQLTLTAFLTETAGPRVARLIRISATVMIAFCFSYYIASQFQGAGVAFDDLFGIGMSGGIILGAIIILAYTFAGGFLAVSVINTVQGVIMMLVAILLPVLAFSAAGGVSGIGAALEDVPPEYLATFGGRAGWIAGGFALGMTATGFGALGQPHLISWIMAARDTKARVMGAGVAIGWGAVVYAGMAVLGLSGRALFGADAPAEGIFFKLAGDLLPGVLAGIVAAAILSAIMSTVDSQLLVASGAISHDLGAARLMGGRTVLATRLAMLVVSGVAVVLTLALPATIFDRTLFAWTALGASFGPVVVVRAFGGRPGGAAVLASILAGFVTSLAYEFVLNSGPGAVWARTVPWIAAFLALAVTRIVAGQHNQALGAPSDL